MLTSLATKEKLLEQLADERKPANIFIQYDCFLHGDHFPDSDGDEFWGPMVTSELMTGSNVRIFIQPETKPDEVIRLLSKALESFKRNSEDLASAERTVDSWCSYVMDREFHTPEGWQLQDMLTLAKIVIVSARRRTETRGVHCREDFPDISEQWQHHSSICRKDENYG